MTAEQIVLSGLKAALSVPVWMEHQQNEPAEFVILERVGGRQELGIERASFAVQSYSDSMYGACALNEKVRTAMLDLIADPHISHIELDSDYNYTDTETKKYRYQGIYDLVFFS